MSPGKFSPAASNNPPFSPAHNNPPQFSPVSNGGSHPHHPSPFSPAQQQQQHHHRPASANSGSERSTPTSPMGRYGGDNPPQHHLGHHGGHPQQQQHQGQLQQQYHLQELGGPADLGRSSSAAAPGGKNHRSSGSLEGSESSENSVRSGGHATAADSTPGQVAAISSTDMATTPESVGGLAEAFRPPSHHQHQGGGDLLLGDGDAGGGASLTPEMGGLQVCFFQCP